MGGTGGGGDLRGRTSLGFSVAVFASREALGRAAAAALCAGARREAAGPPPLCVIQRSGRCVLSA